MHGYNIKDLDFDDLYDRDIETDKKCPKCGKSLFIASDCQIFCSYCDYREK